MQVDLTELKNEFMTDPENIGYSVSEQRVKNGSEYTYYGHWAAGNDQALLELINDKEINGQVEVKSLSMAELQVCIVGVEFLALTSAKQLMWDLLTRSGIVEVSHLTVRGQISAIWEGTTTLTNIEALYTRAGSRAEELFGFGTQVTMQNIIDCKEV